MALHWRPLGPEPAETYWRRRALVVAALAAVVLLGVGLRALGGDDQAPDRLAEGAASPSASPGSASPGSASPASADPSPGASASPAATPDPSATADPAAAPACEAPSLQLVTAADAESYPVGGRPRLELRVTNTGPAPCSIDVGQAAVSITVMSGSDRIWSSDDCAPGGDADLATLAPGEPEVSRVTWAGRRSLPGCEGPEAQAEPGTYRVTGQVGALEASGGTFRFTG